MVLLVSLVIVFAVAMIVGPIMMARPSRRQTHLAALRARASQLGLDIKLMKTEQETAVAYQKTWPREDRVFAGPVWCLVRADQLSDAAGESAFNDGWVWLAVSGDTAPVPQAVVEILRAHWPKLPSPVTRVEATPRGLCCFWDEMGDTATVQALAEWLQPLSVKLWPLLSRERPVD